MTASAIAIIQARMSSSRLPGKVLKPLAGKPMVGHIVDRARQCCEVDEVIVATSTDPTDDPLAEYCESAGIRFYRGDLHRVLDRFRSVLKSSPHDYVVRITGDCPLIHPDYIDRQILLLQDYCADHCWISEPCPLLEGQGVHSARSLEYVAENSQDPIDQEHVGSLYFAEHPSEFRTLGLRLPENYYEYPLRITVDEEDDYAVMKRLYEELWDGDPIPLEKAVFWLSTHSDESQRNQSVSHSPINRDLSEKRRRMRPYVVAIIDSRLRPLQPIDSRR